MAVFPRQKLSSTEKAQIDKTTKKSWSNNCIDFLIEESAVHSDREDLLSLGRLVEDELSEKDYEYVLNPFNTTVDRYKRFGVKLRNYNIISPVLGLYAGEFSQRFKNVNVLETNAYDDNDYKKGLNKLLKQYYAQQTANELNALGIDTGKETVEQPPVKDAVDEFNRDFDANRVISGQEILEYIIFDQDLDDKYQDAYLDWLTYGKTFSYKGVFNDDVDFEVVRPWEVTVPKNTKSNFAEDAPWIVRRQVMDGNQIIDRWHKELSEDDVAWLDEESQNKAHKTTGYVHLPSQWISDKADHRKYSILNNISGFEVYHTQWRSFRKVGILNYYDALGQPATMEVDDTYVLDKAKGDISIEWEWMSEVREGWRIGDSTRYIYLHERPLPYNRMELNNSSAQKLSYNGRINTGVTGKPISIVNSGRNYQILYNIVHYQFEKAINKNKDKVLVMPQGLIPKGKHGWDEEKHMYYAHANSYMVVDETSPTAAIAMQGIKVLDMSLGTYIKDMIGLMQAIKSEWWDAIGMNRQRFGDSMASDGKGVTEQAIFRSSLISDELNRKFEKLQEKDYAGLLDISKVAFINGKKGKYINSGGREAFLELAPDGAAYRLESDFDIHVKNSRLETEKIQTAKEYGFSLGQNSDAPTMLELIDASNFAKTKEVVAKIDRMKDKREADMADANRKSAEDIANTKAATETAKNDTSKYVANRGYEEAIDVELLKQQGEQNAPAIDNSMMDAHKQRIDNRKLENDSKKVDNDTKKTSQDIKESNARIKHMGDKKTVTSN